MRKVWTSFNKSKKIILFLFIIFIIGLISGFIYFNLIKESIVIDLKAELFDLTLSFSNLIFHCIVLSIIVIFSFMLIGTFCGLFVYFYEAMSIGFVISAFLTLISPSPLATFVINVFSVSDIFKNSDSLSLSVDD